MPIIRLGFINAWRNLARSAFALLSIAFAAGFLTNAISLSRGYGQGLYAPFRTQLGGEIIVYDKPVVLNLDTEAQAWDYHLLPYDYLTDIAIFYPEVIASGYHQRLQHEAFTSERQQQMAELPGIASVYPRYQIPVRYQGPTGGRVRSLRGRDYTLDLNLVVPPSALLNQGRWFAYGEESLVAVVTRQMAYLTSDRDYVSKTLSIEVPRISKNTEGYLFDFSDPLSFDLLVVGVQNILTRTILAGSRTIPFFWDLDEIQIPIETWRKIWSEAAPGLEFIPEELSLQVEEMVYLEDIVFEVQQAYPEHTAISVPQIIEKAFAQGLIENLEVTLAEQLATARSAFERDVISEEELLVIEYGQDQLLSLAFKNRGVAPEAMPSDLRLPSVVLIFANAALVMAANLLILVNERTREIGILKAVGAKRSEIMAMVWAESGLLSLLGCSIGFLFMRLPTLLNQIVQNSDISEMLLRFFSDAALVYTVSLTAALLFGLLPALRMANLPAMEVLRSD